MKNIIYEIWLLGFNGCEANDYDMLLSSSNELQPIQNFMNHIKEDSAVIRGALTAAALQHCTSVEIRLESVEETENGSKALDVLDYAYIELFK